MSEQELDRLAGSRLQLEMQVNTLESANLNAETMGAMKKASDALKVIHGNLWVNFLSQFFSSYDSGPRTVTFNHGKLDLSKLIAHDISLYFI